ncbi:MAG: tetratricopeptide repeat protein [Bacteroidota bacterium]|nr:tetratricopeptide repeat protein [Bacteroidota bacterium]
MDAPRNLTIPHHLQLFFYLVILTCSGFSFNLFSQSSKPSLKEIRVSRIDSLFDGAEQSHLNTNGVLRYEYFFSDERKDFLDDFATRLENDSFEVIGLYAKSDEWQLRVMRNEHHSRQSIEKQERKFRWLKFKFLIDKYDGFAIWPGDLTPDKIPQDEFTDYANNLGDEELFWVADRLLQLKSYPKALVAWQKAIDRNVYPDTSSYKFGTTLIATNEFVDGIELWEKAVQFNPKYLEVYMELGKIFYENSHWKKALTNFQKADALDPDNSEILYHVAETLFQMERYSDAYTTVKRSVRLDRNNDFARHLLKMTNLPSIKKARKAELKKLKP